MATIKLTSDEKAYMFGKVEYTKKKKMKEATEGKFKDLHELFTGKKGEVSEDEWNSMLGCLENTFKHAIGGTGVPLKSEMFKSIVNKIPSGWSATTKSSSLEAKKKKDEINAKRAEKESSKKNESSVLDFKTFVNEKYDGGSK